MQQAEEKEDLYNIILEIDEEDKKLNRVILIAVVSMLSVTLLVITPKIYLRNSIYYKSRNIAQLKYQHSALAEENLVLKQKLQELKFKNQTIDTIY